MKQVVLTAPKMSCGHCKMAVEDAAAGIAGVDSVSADPETKKIEIAYDESSVSLEDIKQVIGAAGYPVE
jgi:copper chaperone